MVTGERGKELIVPESPGMVISNRDLYNMVKGGGKKIYQTVNFHVTAPGGFIGRQTQMQTALMLQRVGNAAIRKNG
jgi:hypothetical protein